MPHRAPKKSSRKARKGIYILGKRYILMSMENTIQSGNTLEDEMDERKSKHQMFKVGDKVTVDGVQGTVVIGSNAGFRGLEYLVKMVDGTMRASISGGKMKLFARDPEAAWACGSSQHGWDAQTGERV